MFSQLKFDADSRPCAALPDSSASTQPATTRVLRPVNDDRWATNVCCPLVSIGELTDTTLPAGAACDSAWSATPGVPAGAPVPGCPWSWSTTGWPATGAPGVPAGVPAPGVPAGACGSAGASGEPGAGWTAWRNLTVLSL